MIGLIIGGGCLESAFLEEMLARFPEAVIIAADRGAETLKAVGRYPDYMLGDFDSASAETKSFFEASRCPTEVYPAEKDFTDTEAAIRKALAMGCEELWLLGMTGGRLDHFLANVHNLLLPLEAGVRAVIADPQNRISLLDGRTVVRKDEAFGRYISFLPLTDRVEGLTLEGFRYPLNKCSLGKGISLCVSNEMAENEAIVSFDGGILMMIQSKDRK
ncbi:MAG: thiamine diphosphokinase [Lachnospiraceae bacterium]|nr:thiamine diphosphokinase [Lachnospiraceae bacterium]